jgi:hypothetical protein
MHPALQPAVAAAPQPIQLRADCARCSGLCCVQPAFDAEQGFGFDKPAGAPCAHLQTDFHCGIHHLRGASGFPACETFDCYGAGQWVTQVLFNGRSWRSSPELAEQMFDAYSRYRVMHELMAMLELAARIASAEGRAPLMDQLQRIERLCATGAVPGERSRLQELRSVTLHGIRAARLRR